MDNEKYGFVYIWRDRKHKRYYIGCHWGNENDGYVCSSSWMKQAYRRRPNDFKRRILIRVYSSRSELLNEEHKFLSLIPVDLLGIKYYNLTIHHNGHWSIDENMLKTVGQKISASPLRNQRISKSHIGKTHSEKTKEKLRAINLGKKHSEETKQKIKFSHIALDRKRPDVSVLNKTRVYSVEERKKRSEISKTLHAEGKIGMIGKKHSVETRNKISESRKHRYSDCNK